MKNFVRRHGFAAASTVGVLAVLALAVGTMAFLWQDLHVGDRGTWVGGIGTVLTLLGTIWLATAESRARRREAHSAAIITAVKLHLIIHSNIQAIGSVVDQLSAPGLPMSQPVLDASANLLRGAETWSLDDLLRLTALPNNGAARLAQGRAIIDKMIVCLGRLPSDPDGVALLPDFDPRNLCQALLDARSELRIGYAECERIIKLVE